MFPRVLVLLALSATVASAQTPVFVSDNFTSSTTVLLEAHKPDIGGAWTRGSGAKGIQVKAASGSVMNVSAADWNVYTNALVAPGPEYFIKVTVTFTNNNPKNFVDLYGRASTTLNNGYAARISANGTVTLFKYVGSVATTLGTGIAKITINTPFHFTFVIDNNFKRASVEGATDVTSSDNTVTGAGLVALGMQSYAAGQTVASGFSATAIAP